MYSTMDIILPDSTAADSSSSTTVSSGIESVQESKSLLQPVLRRSGSLMISDAGNAKGSITATNTDDDWGEDSLDSSSSIAAHAETVKVGEETPARSGHSSDSVKLLMGKGKGKEWTAPIIGKGPRKLLDLPVDVLREIINQVCSLPYRMSSELSDQRVNC